MLVDVAPEFEARASDAVEDACERHRLPAHVLSAATSSPALLAKVTPDARVIA